MPVRFILLIAFFQGLAGSLVIGQEKAAEQWRFRFPESDAADFDAAAASPRRVDIASRPSTATFQKPAQIQVPSLADSRIVLPSKSTAPAAAESSSDVEPSDSRADRLADARNGLDALRDPYAVAPAAFMNQMSTFGGTLGSWVPLRRTNGIWIKPDYLYWSAEGMRTPALVTSSPTGTPQNEAAFLGGTGTSVLYGQGRINEGWEHGYRITAGFGIDPNQRWQLEADYLRILNRNDSFSAISDDQIAPTNIIGRPFFDLINGQETAQLISYDGLVSGRIDIGATSKLSSLGLYGRAATCPTPGPCDVIAINSPLSMQRGRFDVLLGYRYANLQDSISFSEDLRSLDVANPGSFQIREGFSTENVFHGIELGMAYHSRWNRFSTELIAKVAAGNNNQSVNISGYSDIVEAGFLERFPGGVLAQRTNIGTYERNELSVLPQLAFNLGTRLTSYLTLRVGYSLFYFSNVVRAGDHIDTDLNPNLFPPEQLPLVTSVLRPQFEFRETDYWAHGLSFGTDFRF